MKELLNRVRVLNGKENEEDVKNIVTMLGEDYSVQTLEAVAKHYKDELRKIQTKDLLEWMQENDQTSFENEDLKVSIRTYVSAKIMDVGAAFKWLEAHQYGDLIKDTLKFPKGEFTEEAAAALEEMGLSYEKQSGIHPQSLKKVMTDRLASGEELPMEGDEFDVADGIKVNYFDECVVREK